MKRLWIVLLLVSFSFSITHAFVFNSGQEKHCDINEYIEETTTSTDHGDMCDFHVEFHKTFVIPYNVVFIDYINTPYVSISHSQKIPQPQQHSLFRPPIFS